jgi:hypothetical protein
MVAAFMTCERARVSPDSEKSVDSWQRADGSAIQEETKFPILDGEQDTKETEEPNQPAKAQKHAAGLPA